MKINTNPKKIKEILTRNTEEVIDRNCLEKKLKSGRKLRIKLGIDPTSADLHLGHSVVLRKLKQFQELGHQVIFLIGDFTARIGDPSDRADRRKALSENEIKENMDSYIKQAAKILDIKKVEVFYNSQWYKKKTTPFLLDLFSRFTCARLIERDDFKKRIEKGAEVSISEIIYPLLQGYDSVETRADVEIGGADQKFNLLFARKVQKKHNQPQQDIIALPLLVGIDGRKKMSKTYRNYIKLIEEPLEMFGKIMSIQDSLIWHYFRLLTKKPLKEIEKMERNLKQKKINPREAKVRLAREIVSIYHSKKTALMAEKEFNQIFREKKPPSIIPEIKFKKDFLNILDFLVQTKLVSSKTEAKRLVLQKGIKIDNKTEQDWRKMIKIKKGMILKVGKKRFIKIA